MFIVALIVLFISIYTLVKGRIFVKTTIEACRASIDKLDGKIEKKEVTSDEILLLLYVLLSLPLYLILMYQGVSIDALGYPTKVMLVLTVLNFALGVIGNKASHDLSIEEKKAMLYLRIANARKRTFRGTITQVLWVMYSLYLLAVLMGG